MRASIRSKKNWILGASALVLILGIFLIFLLGMSKKNAKAPRDTWKASKQKIEMKGKPPPIKNLKAPPDTTTSDEKWKPPAGLAPQGNR
jgi:hypothetical protein